MKNDFLTPALKECLDRNSRPSIKLGQDLEALLNASKSQEKLLPVVGTQGMGKSTLINAILGEDILPNAADETTCVPVEVAYGEDECAVVHFRGSKDTVKVSTKEELNAYVDNNENPANKKGVEHIRLYRKKDILKDGLIIVDLPGVGSITAANQETTERYIENVRCAIFVIPTVPTIRRREALFIRGAWSQFNRAIFVQNDFGETPAEKADSIDFNTKTLSQISDQYSLNFEKPILLINAYDALVGAVKGDAREVKASGLDALTGKLERMSAQWDENLEASLIERAKAAISAALAQVSRKRDEAEQSDRKTQADRQARYDEFEKQTDEIIDSIDEIRDWLEMQRGETKAKIAKEAEKTTGHIRAEVAKVIDGGAVDGDRLNEAFARIQTREVEDFSMRANDILLDMANAYREKMLDLYEEIEVKDGLEYEDVGHKSGDALKWEKGLQAGMTVGGGIAAALGAKAVAALLISNPAGWAVAAVGMAICGLFSLFGWGAKKAKMDQRKAEAKKELYPKIEEIGRRLNEGIGKKCREFFDSAEESLRSIRNQKKAELRAIRQDLRNPTVVDRSQLDADSALLDSALESLKS